jgi:predicted transglutaminase-like cysteine proteinase
MPALIIDQAHWAQLEQVQAEVDHRVRYVTDLERFGVSDWWEPASDKGDCEDIVLSKRQRLLDMGWPGDALRIAVVIDGHGALHAVLTVDVLSQQGKPATYVLDSHFEHVEPWQYLGQYGYTWLERSKPGSSQWARLDNGGSATVQQMALLATAIMPASPRWSDTQPTQVQVTTSVKLLAETPQVAARPRPVPAVLDAEDNRTLLILASSQKEEAVEEAAGDGDDVTVAPASAHGSRHGRHHGHVHAAHGHSHHGRRHTA